MTATIGCVFCVKDDDNIANITKTMTNANTINTMNCMRMFCCGTCFFSSFFPSFFFPGSGAFLVLCAFYVFL